MKAKSAIPDSENSNANLGSQLAVHIDSLSSDGSAVGRADKLVIFVDQGCPGDDLLVEVYEKRSNFVRAKIVDIVKASEHRIEPTCQVFSQCGGCDWQHVDYQMQLEQKRELILQALRVSGLGKWNDLVQPVIESPDQLGYRNRIQIHHKSGSSGYFKRHSDQLIAIDDCPLAEAEISQQIKNIPPEDGTFQISRMADNTVSIQPRDKIHNDFSQVNSKVNLLLVKYIEAEFEKRIGEKTRFCYDLYSGNGNVSMGLAEKFPDIEFHLIELNQNSHLQSAKMAEKLNNCRAICADVEVQLASYFSFENSIVIVDPPRAGMSKKSTQLLTMLAPETIMYVSCDSATLTRDLNRTLQRGYEIQSVQPFDMFPQTSHVESVTVLIKK